MNGIQEVSGSTPLCSTTTYFVYILKSLKDQKLYTGVTTDVEKRLREHNNGKSLATKHRRPFIVIHFERFASRSDALRRERYSKSKKEAFEKYLILQKFESAQDIDINT